MLFDTSKTSLSQAFEYLSKLPFSKRIIHALSEKARGPMIAFFTLHRVLDKQLLVKKHPHYLHKTALTLKLLEKYLQHINHHLPFISLHEALEYLQGNKQLHRSHAVLLIETCYVQTVHKLSPLLSQTRIPASWALDIKSLSDGLMPWTDEIIYRVLKTRKSDLATSFFDRSFSLDNLDQRIDAAQHLIADLSRASPSLFSERLSELRGILSAKAQAKDDRIANFSEIEGLALNPLFTFINAGMQRLPLAHLSDHELNEEIVQAKNLMLARLGRALVPVYFSSFNYEKNMVPAIMRTLMESGHQAAIIPKLGLARPSDHLYKLPRLALAMQQKSFEQFELQGLLNAIDEFLLVGLAQEQELRE